MGAAFLLLALPLFVGCSALLYGRLPASLMECAQRHGRFGALEPHEPPPRARPVRRRPLDAGVQALHTCAA